MALAPAVKDQTGDILPKTYFSLYDSATGQTPISLPNDWTEMLMQCVYNNAIITSHLTKTMFRADGSVSNIGLGSFGTSYFLGQGSRNSIRLTTANWSGSDVTASTAVYIYLK